MARPNQDWNGFHEAKKTALAAAMTDFDYG